MKLLRGQDDICHKEQAMKNNPIISQKFLEQYFDMAKVLFNDATLCKQAHTAGVVNKLEQDLYKISNPSNPKEESVGILDAKSFWKALNRTEVSKFFNWNEDTYKIICAKLN
jgi:hypothetical protein